MLTDVSHISRSEPILATLQHPVIVVRIEEVRGSIPRSSTTFVQFRAGVRDHGRRLLVSALSVPFRARRPRKPSAIPGRPGTEAGWRLELGSAFRWYASRSLAQTRMIMAATNCGNTD